MPATMADDTRQASAPPPFAPPADAAGDGAARDGAARDEAFHALLVEHLDGAYRLALRLTNSAADAEDLVQEAALRAHRFRARFELGTSFRAWFYRILVNHFYTTVRRRRNDASLDDLSDAHELYLYRAGAAAGLPRGTDPHADTVERMTSADVAAALAALPPEFRTACTLYFLEDLPYHEIAGILGVPVGTVRSRLHRGRRLLQKRLWLVARELGIVPDDTPPADG